MCQWEDSERRQSLHDPARLLLKDTSLPFGLRDVSKPVTVSDSQREQKFQEMMSGVVLVGRSTMLNKEGMSGEERYTIDKVSKLTGDTWLFQTRLKY